MRFINLPKGNGKRGSIKLADGTTLGVFPEKLGLFQAGHTYEIEYTETNANGTTYKNVRSAKEIGQSAGDHPQANSSIGEKPKNSYRETCAKDAERMFVCALLSAAIKAGKLDLDPGRLTTATTTLRRVWETTFGAGPSTSQRAVAAMRAKPIDELPEHSAPPTRHGMVAPPPKLRLQEPWRESEDPAAFRQAAE